MRLAIDPNERNTLRTYHSCWSSSAPSPPPQVAQHSLLPPCAIETLLISPSTNCPYSACCIIHEGHAWDGAWGSVPNSLGTPLQLTYSHPSAQHRQLKALHLVMFCQPSHAVDCLPQRCLDCYTLKESYLWQPPFLTPSLSLLLNSPPVSHCLITRPQYLLAP